MSNIHLVEGLTQDQIKQARKRVGEAWRQGQNPAVEDLAGARGLAVAEREHSIFSDAWVPLAVIFLVGGFFIGRNIPCMTLGSLLLLIVAAGRWWRDRSLIGVVYGRAFDHTHVFPGEMIEMTLTVINDKPLPLTWLQFQDPISGPVRVMSDYAPPIDSLERFSFFTSFSMRAREVQERRVQLLFHKRGFYQVGPVSYRAGDLFTLFTKEEDYNHTNTLVVYPQIWPLEALGLPAKEPFGDLRIRRSLFTDPIRTLGIRDYHPQDRFRDIHWKATARRGSLQTKVYDPSTGLTAAIFLNTATTEKYWMGHEPELLERLIAVAASIASYGAEQGWAVGLFANGAVPRSDQPIKVQPGRSPDQLMHVLEALAAITGYATGTIERLLQTESPRLPWVATFILVSGTVTPEIAVTLTRLREAGRRVVLISLAEEPPPPELKSIITYHIPADLPAFQPIRPADSMAAAALQAVSMAQLESEQDLGVRLKRTGRRNNSRRDGRAR